MIRFISRTLSDLRAHLFLNAVSVVTIALAVLIFSAFLLLFINAGALLDFWIADMRILAYVKPDTPETEISAAKKQIETFPGVLEAVFVSKTQAMERFKSQLGTQASLVEGLKENPLPDSFEVRMALTEKNWDMIEPLAAKIRTLPIIEEVEYGRQWLARFADLLNLSRLTGYALGGLFFMAAVFFVANTIRLILYSRRDEIEIMRLVGASEGFIKDPFYVQSLMLGGAGGILGLFALTAVVRWISLKMGGLEMSAAFFQIRSLPLKAAAAVLAGSMFVGWLGCFISLRQFLKT